MILVLKEAEMFPVVRMGLTAPAAPLAPAFVMALLVMRRAPSLCLHGRLRREEHRHGRQRTGIPRPSPTRLATGLTGQLGHMSLVASRRNSQTLARSECPCRAVVLLYEYTWYSSTRFRPAGRQGHLLLKRIHHTASAGLLLRCFPPSMCCRMYPTARVNGCCKKGYGVDKTGKR